MHFGFSLKFLILSAIVAFFASCNSDSTADVSNVAVNVEVRRFEREIMSVKSKEELTALFMKNPGYVKSLYRTFPDDTALVSHLYYLVNHPETKKLYNQSQEHFGELELIKKDFELAFKHLKHYYPEFKEPKIYTTFTGLENDLFVSDSLIIIALEAFVGPKAHYRPDQPNYILKRYEQGYIVPTVIRFLSNSYNLVDSQDQSFLADMLFFGKSLEFTKTMMPNTPDSLIMGYSENKLAETWVAQDLVWAHFIDKQLLFEKKPGIKEKYFGERPNVPEIGPECPGRIGQWVGWRIIQQYRKEKPKISFQELMANKNAQEIFNESKYRGETEE
jgi:gliding motility-associated lipoprotein GldB